MTDAPQQVVWQTHSHVPYVPSPLVYGQQLFLTKSNLAIMTILNPGSGETLLDSVRLPELKSIYASPVVPPVACTSPAEKASRWC